MMAMSRSFAVYAFIGVLASLLFSTSGVQADPVDREQAAGKVAGVFQQELSEAMAREMGKGGPVDAIRVCGEVAPEIANRLSRENGWRVTRVGTRVRNPLLGMPDAWEQKILHAFAARAAKGEALAAMSHGEVVTEPGGQYYRFMKPLAVQPKCLLCHGSPETIPDTIKAVLKTTYPFDAAIGYKTGDLRGAISIKQPLGKQTH